MRNINLVNAKGEIVATLEIEGATATPAELARHYTQFAALFMRHLGTGLRAVPT